ncbi:MAG: histidinol-phosphate transaminase [Tannerella sp.]|jgi:histidinol-phosphate aminotransferase|nr:histidinol-phosphate transaminase [Tannerella sp.]
MDIEKWVRANIRRLKPYSCARSEFRGEATAYLDANENPMNLPYSRYPDPWQEALKAKIARLKGVRPSQIVVGAGSDEVIDLSIRIFCEPQRDNIVAIDPTYGMYQVCADIHDVEYRRALLNEDFTLDAERLLAATDERTKMIFLCSPNNPTGNLLNRGKMIRIVEGFNGIVVIDEAYVDFSSEASWLTALNRYPNLIVLHTFSKAWGLAAVRCGMAFASEEIIGYFNKVKYPYNINLLTQNFVGEQIENESRKNEWVARLLARRIRLAAQLETVPSIEAVYPSDANFLLVKTRDANGIYRRLVEAGIIVRNRNSVSLCRDCLRITVGTPDENEALVLALLDMDGVSPSSVMQRP